MLCFLPSYPSKIFLNYNSLHCYSVPSAHMLPLGSHLLFLPVNLHLRGFLLNILEQISYAVAQEPLVNGAFPKWKEMFPPVEE